MGETNQKNVNKVLTYAKENAAPNSIMYDPTIHLGWQLLQITSEDDQPIKLSVFEYALNDDSVIYTVSDENGYVYSPPEDQLKGTTIDQEPISFKNKFKSYAMIGLVLFVTFGGFFAKPIGLYFRDLNDPLRNAAERAAESFNEAREELLLDWQEEETKLGKIYIITNDTATDLQVTLSPNFEIYENEAMIGYVQVQSNADQINQFLARKDTAGYDLELHIGEKSIHLMNLNKLAEEKRYIVQHRFYHAEKTIEALTETIEKKALRKFSYPYKSKQEQLDDLSEEQQAKIIFTETELTNQKIEDNLRLLMGPRIRLDDPTHFFYFSTYNKYISKQELQAKLTSFNSMFLKDQIISNCCQVQEVELTKTAPSL